VLLIAATERELVAIDGVAPVCCRIEPVEAALVAARALATLHAAVPRAVAALRG